MSATYTHHETHLYVMFIFKPRLSVGPATINASPWAYIDQYVSLVCDHMLLVIKARVTKVRL